MTTFNTMPTAAADDAELVNESIAGNRDAFGLIVSRYQSLVCSLAYSATGSLTQSEDLAQETFVTAWKQLGHLREREKLRSWLCGIARNLINNTLRRQGREPSHAAESLEEVHEAPSPEPLPAEQTISREEEAILWRSLERIPEMYREPLVLFYREHQSIERVAQNLELTEDAVKQRLSRGRKLLQEQVLAFVEGALGRTNPGRAFTLGVLAALPVLTISAKAATLGAAAAKGGATAKAAGAMGVFGAILGPLLIVSGNYANYRIGLEEARTEEERRYVKSFFRRIMLIVCSVFAVFAAALLKVHPAGFRHTSLFVTLFVGFVVIYLVTTLACALASVKGQRRYFSKVLAAEHAGKFPPSAFEFRSRATLLGLPLVHVRIGDRFDLLQKPVKAWIAFGNYAIGGLFAFGGIAVAPLCIGFCGIGLLPFAGVAIGLCSLGGLALGYWAVGGLAIGWQSLGCFAVAWNAATGNLALAHDFATGNLARAAQANTDAADAFVRANGFFRFAEWVGKYSVWLNFLWAVPLFAQWRIITRHRRQRESVAR